MSNFLRYLEMAKPRDIDINKTYYHGTSITSAGQKILKEGIKPPTLEFKKNKLTPREGKVYITTDIFTAAIYTVGANVLNLDYFRDVIDWDKYHGRYGWIFEISGKDLIDIEPDEDGVGEILYAYGKKRQGKKAFTDVEYDLSESLEWLMDLAYKILTEKQYNAVMDYNDYADFANAGKKLIPKMNDKQKLELITRGTHIAHTGNIMSKKAWKVDKSLTKMIEADGSNIFQIGKKVK